MTTASDYQHHIQTLTAGTQAALEASGYDALVVHCGRRVLRSHFDDLEHPFAVVPTFAHWCELRWPGSLLVVHTDGDAQLLAHEHLSMWEQEASADFELIESALKVEVVGSMEQMKDHLPSGRVAFVGHDFADLEVLSAQKEHFNPQVLVEALEELRVRKSAYEVEAMALANRRAVRGHVAIAQMFDEGLRSELGLQLAFLAASGQDATETPYGNIVALGAHAAVLHHRQYLERPEARSLLVDAGASHRGYAADITRTYAADDAPPEFADLVKRVDAVQQRAAARVTIGQPYEQLHDFVHEALATEMVELGLFTCSPEAALARGLTRAVFPHGLGHSIGIQVHDVGCRKNQPRDENRFLRNTRTMEADQVFTLEPGVYFIEQLLHGLKDTAGDGVNWKLVELLKPLGGVRIEDDVLVLPEGAPSPVRNLSREAFAECE